MIVEPAAAELAVLDADLFHRRAVGAQPIGHDGLGSAIALHRALHERQSSLAIPVFRGKDLQHLAFLINGPPSIISLTVDLHEDFATGVTSIACR